VLLNGTTLAVPDSHRTTYCNCILCQFCNVLGLFFQCTVTADCNNNIVIINRNVKMFTVQLIKRLSRGGGCRRNESHYEFGLVKAWGNCHLTLIRKRIPILSYKKLKLHHTTFSLEGFHLTSPDQCWMIEKVKRTVNDIGVTIYLFNVTSTIQLKVSKPLTCWHKF